MKTTLKIGLVTAIISIIIMFGFFSVMAWLNDKNNWGMHADTVRGIGGLLSIPIQAIGIYIAMQDVKKQTGMLTYGQAIKTGMLVAVTIAVLVAIFSFIYCQWLNPGFADYMIKDAQKAMNANHESPQQIYLDCIRIAAQYTTGAQVMQALVGQFVTGSIMALIIGIFAKTKGKSA